MLLHSHYIDGSQRVLYQKTCCCLAAEMTVWWRSYLRTLCDHYSAKGHWDRQPLKGHNTSPGIKQNIWDAECLGGKYIMLTHIVYI